MGRRIYFISLTLLISVTVFTLGCATTGDLTTSLGEQTASEITDINIQSNQITVKVNNPFAYTIYRSSNPYKVVVEFPNVSIGAFNQRIVPENTGITEILPSQKDPPLAPIKSSKLEIFLKEISMIEPEYGDNTLIIKFNEVSPKQISKEKKDALQPQTTLQHISSTSDYVIGDEDVLQISVWGSPELSVQVPVRPDGMISVPLVGDVKAAGVTPQELKATLEKEFAKFVKTPTVSVIVTAVNSFKIYILGEGTATSGAVTSRRNTTLMQLLAQLGSLKNADLNNSYILRDGQKLTVDFYKLISRGDISQDIQLRPNDVLFIPDNYEKRITVVGAVKKPTVIPYREGITVLDAILSAGDFTEFAKQNDVIVVRKEGSEVRNIEVRLKDVIKGGEISKDIPLKPGDLIIVKTGIF